jgi:hypothetical protein
VQKGTLHRTLIFIHILIWFVGRGPPCFGPSYVDMTVCLPGVRRGFPLVWVTQVDWPGRCAGGFVCPSIVEDTVDWFGLTVDLLFWTLLFVLLLGLLLDWHPRRKRREKGGGWLSFGDSSRSSQPDVAEWARRLIFGKLGAAVRAVPSHDLTLDELLVDTSLLGFPKEGERQPRLPSN